MIQKLSIRNFKSVRELDLSCRRVNVFIGEPNAGKTNILESMSLLCRQVWGYIPEALRVDSADDLFFDQNPKLGMGVSVDDVSIQCVREHNEYEFWFRDSHEDGYGGGISLGQDCHLITQDGLFDDEFNWPINYYLFGDPGVESRFETEHSSEALEAPYGQNMPSLLGSNRSARQTAAAIIGTDRYRLTVDLSKARLLIAREEDNTLLALPYSSTSETLRRMVFHRLAIDSHANTAILFDEPEAHAYPPYTKILAEKIALDNRGNQFFLTTHSPYMLDSLISKTPADDLNIILCRMENFETKAYVMSEEQKVQIMEWSMDAFFNFDRLLPEIA